MLVALALDRMGHKRGALATAVLAVLAKEVMLLVLLGWALTRGRRALLRLVGVPAAFAGGWWLVLRVWFPGSSDQSEEFSVVRGLIHAVRIWFDGGGRISGAVVAASVAAGVYVLYRRGRAIAARRRDRDPARAGAVPEHGRARRGLERPAGDGGAAVALDRRDDRAGRGAGSQAPATAESGPEPGQLTSRSSRLRS